MWFIFSTKVLIRHLWQLKTAVFLHWCLICALSFGLWACPQILRPDWKGFPRTNTLAYYDTATMEQSILDTNAGKQLF